MIITTTTFTRPDGVPLTNTTLLAALRAGPVRVDDGTTLYLFEPALPSAVAAFRAKSYLRLGRDPGTRARARQLWPHVVGVRPPAPLKWIEVTIGVGGAQR